MSLLRIRVSLADPSGPYQWALHRAGHETVSGETTLAQVPRGARRIQMVLPAAQVSITRAHLPAAARRHAGTVLAFAIEEETVGDPDAVSVRWLGTAKEAGGDADVLAVIDRAGLATALDVLHGAGFSASEIHCETLLLPWVEGEWTLCWDGREGFVRRGLIEGSATDCGDASAPPLCLRLLIDEARSRGECPASIAVHVAAGCAPPDPVRWQHELGVPIRLLAPWAWQSAPADAGIPVAVPYRRWGIGPDTLLRLRPAAYVAAIALVLHALALSVDWGRLAVEQSTVRDGMAAQFRATFPDAVAVVDPALQMRRKIAEARHAAGRTDGGDFLPLFEQVASAAKDLDAGAPRAVAYENARLTLEFPLAAEGPVRRVMGRMLDAGLGVELHAGPPTRSGGATLILSVRSP
jgi:general secretion pathway protein L